MQHIHLEQILTQKDNDGTLTIDDINSMDKMTYINYMPDGMDESLFFRLNIWNRRI